MKLPLVKCGKPLPSFLYHIFRQVVERRVPGVAAKYLVQHRVNMLVHKGKEEPDFIVMPALVPLLEIPLPPRGYRKAEAVMQLRPYQPDVPLREIMLKPHLPFHANSLNTPKKVSKLIGGA